MKQMLMGNEAMALGAIHAGAALAAGYPGTPSTEVLEAIARYNKDKKIYVEWSVNEKAALEIAAGASLCGMRTIVTMKQVGLNVASDPLMSLAYVGVKGGMVVLAADDPGPMSSQTEQDTREFARFSRLPVFDPSSPAEAYAMMAEAFALSEKYQTPVLMRPTTRVCHGTAVVDVQKGMEPVSGEGFIRDTARWVIFPKSSYLNHIRIEKRNALLEKELSSYHRNSAEIVDGKGSSALRWGIAACGISYEYAAEALSLLENIPPVKLVKISTPHPFPMDTAAALLKDCDRILTAEELSPYVEHELQAAAGALGIKTKISGKGDGFLPCAGEYDTDILLEAIINWFAAEDVKAKRREQSEPAPIPPLPGRPPVLCAGCPHRGAFYSVKKAMKGKKAIFCGDIGCYTLGNAPPLEMVDTCLCMGADMTMAQGIARADKDAVCFAFIGDSTFFASGITGIINAVYNGTRIIPVILDNSTTAMTGHQPHPGTGMTMMGQQRPAVDMKKLLEALGITVIIADPLDIAASEAAVQAAVQADDMTAIIFRSPCIARIKPKGRYEVEQEKCIACKLCMSRLGCPALSFEDNKVQVISQLCTGCGLCAQICPKAALKKREK